LATGTWRTAQTFFGHSGNFPQDRNPVESPRPPGAARAGVGGAPSPVEERNDPGEKTDEVAGNKNGRMFVRGVEKHNYTTRVFCHAHCLLCR